LNAYRLTLGASDDLHRIYSYTRKNFGKVQADFYVADLKKACEAVADTPGIGRNTDNVIHGLRRHEHAEHIIFFMEQAPDVLIVRILGRHQHWQVHLQ
jgi:toxin ParE1/3/4